MSRDRSSNLFMVVAWLVIFGSLLLAAPGDAMVLWMLAAAVIAGLPHGALDAWVLRQTGQGRWFIAGLLGYALAALSVILAWIFFPAILLGAFLFLAGFHFAISDPLAPTRRAALFEGLARGGAPLATPAFFHQERTAELFGMLASGGAGERLAEMLGLLFWPWLASLILALVLASRGAPRRVGFELLTLLALFALVPPLPAFAIYFALLHSPRSMVATLQKTGLERKGWFFDAVWPTLATIAAALVIFATGMAGGFSDAGVVRVLFVGLAAVTFPHVILWTIIIAREGGSHQNRRNALIAAGSGDRGRE